MSLYDDMVTDFPAAAASDTQNDTGNEKTILTTTVLFTNAFSPQIMTIITDICYFIQTKNTYINIYDKKYSNYKKN